LLHLVISVVVQKGIGLAGFNFINGGWCWASATAPDGHEPWVTGLIFGHLDEIAPAGDAFLGGGFHRGVLAGALKFLGFPFGADTVTAAFTSGFVLIWVNSISTPQFGGRR
jgi:hypothetical protein